MTAIETTHGGVGQPATYAVAVSPDDNNDIAYVSRAIYVGGAGNLEVVMLEGQTVVFSGIAAGTLLPIRVTRVKSGNTTATLILALK
jgi:hypothetical protein